MTPADVPDELAQLAADAYYTEIWGAARPTRSRQALANGTARRVLAAVLPLHEQQVRESIAAELAKLATPCGTRCGRTTFDRQCGSCLRYTALLGAQRLVLRDGRGGDDA